MLLALEIAFRTVSNTTTLSHSMDGGYWLNVTIGFFAYWCLSHESIRSRRGLSRYQSSGTRHQAVDWDVSWWLKNDMDPVPPVAYSKGHFEKLTWLSVSMPFEIVLSHRHLLYLRRAVCLAFFRSPQVVGYRSRLQSNYRESGSWMERPRTEKNERME